MTGPGGLLDLSGGARLVLDGREWEVASFEPHTGRVSLRGGGQELRTEHAREVLQGQAAAADRPAGEPAAGTVVALRQPAGWQQRAGEVAAAVDAERRRRRESAPPPYRAPARLGERRRSLFAVPAEDGRPDGGES